ncbi:MAG: hypothetical protein HOW97_42625 [Catenulispora sp.]|nr:hypothetical protein [Catenulispora sp.]
MALASDLGAYAGTAVLLGFVGYRFGADRAAGRTGGRRAEQGPRDPFRWLVAGFGLFGAGSLAILAPASLRLLTDAGVGEASVVGIGDSLRTAAVSFLMAVAFALQPVAAIAGTASTADNSAAARSSPSAPIRTPPTAPAPPSAPHAPHAPRSWVAPAIAVQLAMGVLFAAARPRADADGTLSVDVPGRWALAAHYLLFLGYALVCLTALAAALLPQTRHRGSRQLRIGVRLVVAALGLGGVWTLWTLDDIVAVARHGVQGGSDDSVSNLFGVSCAVLLLAGGTVGWWGGALTAPRRRWRAYQRYRVLGPLWSALLHELPHIALEPGDSPRLRADVEFLAYRRAIEIHDARLALRPHRRPGFEDWLAASGVEVSRYTSAELEAAALADAVANLRADRRFDGGGAGPDADPAPGADAGAESAWLGEVARAYRRSPLVRLAADRARAEAESAAESTAESAR